MNIRKHWKKILLSSAALFWASCGGDNESTIPTGGNDDPKKVQPDNIDGLKIDTLYGVLPFYSSSSIINSSNSNKNSTSINCYTTFVKGFDGRSYDIFECDNGKRYLKDYRIYKDGAKDNLPSDIIWSKPYEGKNCNFNGVPLCVDKWTSDGKILPGSGCAPTVECPYKEQESFSTFIK